MRVLVTYHVSNREPVVIALANAFYAHNDVTQMQEHIQVIDAIDIAKTLYSTLPSFEFDAMLTELNRLTKPPTMPPSTEKSKLQEACEVALEYFEDTRHGREWTEQGGLEADMLRQALNRKE